jgi:Fe-S cluster assembly scaffold protein SufB
LRRQASRFRLSDADVNIGHGATVSKVDDDQPSPT